NSEYARQAANSLRESISINERLQSAYAPYVAYVILPLFALANGGIPLAGMGWSTLLAPASIGIIVGLFVGKQIGIFGIVLACVKAKLLPLPPGVRLLHLWGMSIVAGIGFTMSLFVAGLAFEEGSVLHDEARAGILVGSLLSTLVGLLVLRLAPIPGAKTMTATTTAETTTETATASGSADA
ncbi:MAG TPA: Na+/H+ antiporter NhaA, partial [Myxococcota bacterium]